jgi:hypothetical protein
MGEERLQALLEESLAVATKTGAMKPSELSRVIVDTTVQPKNIAFPTDATPPDPGLGYCSNRGGPTGDLAADGI